MSWTLAILLLAAPDFSGEWIHTFGRMTLEQKGKKVEGTAGRQFHIDGTADGPKLAFEYVEGAATGKGSVELDGTGQVFRGSYSIAGNRTRNWIGFRRDPNADKAKRADFGGYWFSNQGTFHLDQKGKKVTGTYGSTGWVKVEGEIEGRILKFTWEAPWGRGDAWLEQSADGSTIFGMGTRAPRPNEWLWHGRRVEGHEPDVKPEAGEIVGGISKNRVTYHLRAPDGWKKSKPVDAIVILHGSNMSSRAYVNTIASAWPDLGKEYFLIGIDGDKWADWSKPGDDRFNYHYANWMGRSTYKGYPNTERDSPWAIAETLKELQGRIRLGRVFIGGHSQGGFCTWAMCMHYPETFAGAFPMSCALLMQCAPEVFDDEEMIAAQKATPIAIIHSPNDPVVNFGGSEYAYEQFKEHGFPYVRLYDPERGGHMFGMLPVDEAIAWLDAVSSADKEKLEPYIESDDPRIAATALMAAGETSKKLEAKAAKGAAKYEKQLKKGEVSDAFYEWRDEYEFTKAAAEAMKLFYALREEQEEAATKLFHEGRTAMRKNDRDTAWEKYEEIVEKYKASSHYRKVKGWLEKRD